MAVTSGWSPLDEAHAARLAGDANDALRRAVAVLVASPSALGAAALLARLLVEADRPLVASEVAARLVDAFTRRGDLPSAVAAAYLAAQAGEDAAPHFEAIAAAFGKGSARLGDVSPVPPPLPTAAPVDGALGHLDGPALLDRAEEALRTLLGANDPLSADAAVPELPLFAELPPRALAGLLRSLEVRDVAAGNRVLVQGTEGREAFVVVRGLLEVTREGEAPRVTLAALGPGAIFGEMALVSEAPRAATVTAVEPVELLCVSREALEELAAAHPAIAHELGAFCQQRMLSNLMRHSAILGAVAEVERADLVARFQTRTFEVGEALVSRGAEGGALFLLASGGVDVMGVDADGDALRIARLGPGDVVGEISLVLRRPATATVTATHPTVALELTRDAFQDAIKAHPSLLNELYDLATRREEETRTVVAQEALDVDDVVLV